MKGILLVLCLLPWVCSVLYSQNLLGSNPVLPQIHARTLAWADYDGDGDVDLLMGGRSTLGSTIQLLRNDGATAFTSIPVPFHGWPFGAMAWGDMDGDGDPDLVETGRADDLSAWQNGRGAVAIWRNNGTSGFAAVPTALPGLEAGTVSWSDLDADGDMDVLLTGREQLQGPMAVVGENVGGVLMAGGPSGPDGCGVGGFLGGIVCIGDLGGDGLPDVVALGQDAKGGVVSCIGSNLGGLRFDCQADALPLVMDGAVAAADMEGDGDLDLVVTGIGRPYKACVLVNAGGGLSESPLPVPGLGRGAVAWGDVDGDGLKDLVLAGMQGDGRNVAHVLRQSPVGVFAELQPGLPLTGLREPCLALGDWSGDGRPDLVISGLDASGRPAALLYKWNINLNQFEP